MKKGSIRILIGLMGLALVGLIIVQILLIKDSVDWKRSQFERSVNTALANVSYKLERQEEIKKIKKSRAGRKVFQRIDSLRKSSVFDLSAEHLGDTMIFQTDNEKFVFSSDIDHEGNSTAFTFEIQEISVDKDPYKELKKIANPFEYKDIWEEMVVELTSGGLTKRIKDRIDLQTLDSLLQEELKIWGIDTQYEFTVVDVSDNSLFSTVSDKPAGPELINTPYSVQLFTNELFDSPHFLKVKFPNGSGYLLSTMFPFLLISTLFLLLIIGGFYYTINTIMRQKKVSEIKNDFISNMTHELKTPISTISLACEALVDPDMQKSETTRGKFVGMIKEENKRLGVLVENVLKTAVLDKGKMKFSPEPLDVHELLSKVIANFELPLKSQKGKLEKRLNAKRHIIKGDKVHLTNVFYNLLDNALKYTDRSPEIIVRTFDDKEGLKIEFEDNGIGISKEDQKKVFDQLYRVPKGNLHDVKGFGLGLHYVKVILEKHLGQIFVASTLVKGSTFTILLPTHHESEN
ncbi:MAG: HAMP domain-containing histidine kinase [Flavobacteriales bacterium]|nr:HAMP domain-containing histidine kinase [Flavobacteriales bacterium]